MLLEIENQLYKKIHSTIGQSAVVMRLAEEIDNSGRVAEQTMIVVSWTGANTNNPNKGAYIPTVRNRMLNYSVTIVQKQTQREGHSFALPLLDLIADSVTGWVPEVPGLEFHTGFELGNERFVEVTDSSQFIYEQNFSIEVLLADGRFYSQPCAAFDPISTADYLPQRKCLLTPTGKYTGLAIWRRKTGQDSIEEYIVDDSRCPRAVVDSLEITCSERLDGTAEYQFIPREAISLDSEGNRVIDNSKIVSGTLSKYWKCYKDSNSDYPDWFKLNINSGLWRNAVDSVPNNDPDLSAFQLVPMDLNKKYNP